MTHTPWTFSIHMGGELTGVDAEIAELEGCDPFDLSQIRFDSIPVEITWDSRIEGATESCIEHARLIAAAPELLEALKTAEPLLAMLAEKEARGAKMQPWAATSNKRDTHNLVRDAIKKAVDNE